DTPRWLGPHTAHGPKTHAHAGQALRTAGLAGQVMRVRFTWTASDAAFRNELGLNAVDDASGSIGTLRPGDHGYAAAALARARRRVVFASGERVGATRSLELPAGQLFGLYLVQNGTSGQFMNGNPSNSLQHRPVVLFSFTRANPDGRAHM